MTVRDELQQEWDAFMVERNAKGKYTQAENWRRANPGEWQKLQEYRAGGARPTLVTSFGLQMVQHVDAWRLVDAPSTVVYPSPSRYPSEVI